jgi:hypothetical protein
MIEAYAFVLLLSLIVIVLAIGLRASDKKPPGKGPRGGRFTTAMLFIAMLFMAGCVFAPAMQPTCDAMAAAGDFQRAIDSYAMAIESWQACAERTSPLDLDGGRLARQCWARLA